MGRVDGVVHLVADVADVARLTPGDPDMLAYVTQTTLSVDDTREVIEALRQRFPKIVGPDVRDICYATQNRQAAVRALAGEVDLILVIGAANSSNSNRLRELAASMGVRSYLVASAEAVDPAWLDGVHRIGITAGASAPEFLVQELIDWLRARYPISVETLPGLAETIQFNLPPQLAGEPPAPSV
jgi:4-hydroxy-3-methylbut-2-enyl diphosphate reductase